MVRTWQVVKAMIGLLWEEFRNDDKRNDKVTGEDQEDTRKGRRAVRRRFRAHRHPPQDEPEQ